MKSFCSDGCIVQYHSQLITHYEKEEKDIRKFLTLNKEACFVFKENSHYIQKTLEKPQEIWEDVNELGEKVYFFFAHYDEKDFPFTMIIITYMYQKIPSFVFFQTVTNSEEILNEYRRGEKVSDIPKFFEKEHGEAQESEKPRSNNEVQVELTQVEMDSLERKKSSLLAELLQKRLPSDIPFENFYLYDVYIPSTIDVPDEVFSFDDEEGDELFVYLKGHAQGGVTFYYIVLCTKLNMNQKDNTQEEVLYPILSFPTLDGKLYRQYCRGEKISGNLKN
ncbi:MAG: hypothetical protein ACOYL6_07795 [Bacteriovoracaceae bacterium]